MAGINQPPTNSSKATKRYRNIGDNVVLADFGATRRAEQAQGRKTTRVLTIAETWASKLLMETITSQCDAGRLSRGRDYFRAKHVKSLEINQGEIRALVQGSQPLPFEVTMEFPQIPQQRQLELYEYCAQNPEDYFALLASEQLPPAIASILQLEPAPSRVFCDCPDSWDTCKHVVAVSYELGKQYCEEPLQFLKTCGVETKSLQTLHEHMVVLEYNPTFDNETRTVTSHGESAYNDEHNAHHNTHHNAHHNPAHPGEQEIVDSATFWGTTRPSIVPAELEWTDPLLLGNREALMGALKTVTWTHVDQLNTLYDLDRCFELLEHKPQPYDYSKRWEYLEQHTQKQAPTIDNPELQQPEDQP